jgi:hypothetical protein
MKLKQSDWAILLPVNKYPLGKTVLNLKPLSLQELPPVIEEFKKIRKLVETLGVNAENYKASMAEIIDLVIQNAPGVLSLLSGLDEADVVRLPVGVAIDLMTQCVEINLESQQDFLKNLMALAEKTSEMTGIAQSVLEN